MARRRNPRSVKNFKPGSDEGNPLVYLEISPSKSSGNDNNFRRLHIELLRDTCPRTSENFRLLCVRKGGLTTVAPAGEHSYVNSSFHRIIPSFMMQGGDITTADGTGGKPAHGRVFRDENFTYKHVRGAVSMAHQNNTNKSQFFICFNDCSWLDGKHCVFGQVVSDDFDFLQELESYGTDTGRPTAVVKIKDCGQISGIGLSPSS